MKKRQHNSARASALQITLSAALMSFAAMLFASSFRAAAPAAPGKSQPDVVAQAGFFPPLPQGVGAPTLGNHPNTSVPLSGNATVTPDAIIVFSAGSLIIPMDTGASGQDNGMLRAYGLVYAFLTNNVPVSWVIDPVKAAGGNDFTLVSGTLEDVESGASISIPRSYRGGPFVIAASDAALALPIIQTWQAVPGDNTVVHRLTSGSFSANVARTLIRAPRIAVLKDGNESIAFSNLNAVGIPDSTGATWSAASPDLLTEAAVAGPTTSDHADGILFHVPTTLPRYCYLASMHYVVTATTPEVVQEVRSSLATVAFTHAFMQCEAMRAFENDAAGGYFLTTLGLADDGSAPTSPIIRAPANPLAQIDGTFATDSGSVDSIGLGSGSTFRTGVTTLINQDLSPLTTQIVLLDGKLDGVAGNGQVTYLAGHDYAIDLPISANPQTNGVRLFLNSIFESGCATDPVQADVTLTKSAPALINTNTIPYTINYTNPGPRPVENVKIIDKLPAGTTYLAGSGVPTPTSTSGGVLTWNLPTLASGAGGSVTFSASVTSDGTYANTAKVQFSHVAVRAISSNTVTTIRDTVPPAVVIPGSPTNPTVTNDSTPSFVFTVTGGAVLTECRFDSDSFAPCTSPFTASPLVDGPHTFSVRATDAASNVGLASLAFTVDTIAPIVTIPVPPNLTITSDNTPSFTFADVGPPGTAVTFQCRVDADAFVPCTSPFTVGSPLVDGPHTFTVRATDAASNVGLASLAFTVDQLAPVVSIPVPPNVTTTNDSTPSFTFADVGPPGTAVTFQCRVDADAFVPCTSPFTVGSPLVDGPHSFTVRATDAASNVGLASLAFTVDTLVDISGTISYCSNPVPGPVPNVTLTLTGSGSGSTLSDGSGNYMLLSVAVGGTYTVTPSKAALAPGSAGISTVDVVAVQRHFLNVTPIPPGCRLTAADVNGDSAINTSDVIAIQRFALGVSTGVANTGKYQFNPASRSYPGIGSDQTGQDYDALVFGDVASPFVEP